MVVGRPGEEPAQEPIRALCRKPRKGHRPRGGAGGSVQGIEPDVGRTHDGDVVENPRPVDAPGERLDHGRLDLGDLVLACLVLLERGVLCLDVRELLVGLVEGGLLATEARARGEVPYNHEQQDHHGNRYHQPEEALFGRSAGPLCLYPFRGEEVDPCQATPPYP